jgi:pimeloyl-ACP methyl ester carboxylesterase
MKKQEIRPFKIQISDERLDATMAKVRAYDWSQVPDVGGWASGVGAADLKRLVDYWRDNFDWRKIELRLNQLPHYITDIEGERLHFIHLKGNGTKPPLLLIHGWPGSFIEFEAIAGLLAADGHDVVIPSLPGFAFSNPITGIIGPRRAAELMHRLMSRLLGARRYFVQGGDWGAHIASWMAYTKPEAILGFHLNMVGIHAADAVPTSSGEKDLFSRRDVILELETGYNHEQETRPQTLGVALADSPVGSAGWILEKFGQWADLPRDADGSPDLWSRFTEEQLLTNIMLYIAPGSMATSTWIYRGKRLEGSDHFPAGTYISVPTGVAAFPDPVFLPTPRSFVEKTYNIVHWTEMSAGGHFAAMEEPELMLADIRKFVATVSGK